MLAHREAAALDALSERCSALRLAAVALPPLRPSETAAEFLRIRQIGLAKAIQPFTANMKLALLAQRNMFSVHFMLAALAVIRTVVAFAKEMIAMKFVATSFTAHRLIPG